LIYKILEEYFNSDEEPKMNIVSNYEEGSGWRLIIFLRSKHRPDIYFAEDDSKLLFSPAVVDVGGLCITPLEKDFHRLDENLLRNIFNEVFIDIRSFNEISEKVIASFSYNSFNP
jgi:hypothetical protein